MKTRLFFTSLFWISLLLSKPFSLFLIEMEAEPESPIPPTPPREATPEPEIKEDSPEVTETKETKSSNPSKEESSKGSNSGHSRRGRRKVHKNKTYMDKDGFMGRKSLLCLLNIFRYSKVITNTFLVSYATGASLCI